MSRLEDSGIFNSKLEEWIRSAKEDPKEFFWNVEVSLRVLGDVYGYTYLSLSSVEKDALADLLLESIYRFLMRMVRNRGEMNEVEMIESALHAAKDIYANMSHHALGRAYRGYYANLFPERWEVCRVLNKKMSAEEIFKYAATPWFLLHDNGVQAEITEEEVELFTSQKLVELERLAPQVILETTGRSTSFDFRLVLEVGKDGEGRIYLSGKIISGELLMEDSEGLDIWFQKTLKPIEDQLGGDAKK